MGGSQALAVGCIRTVVAKFQFKQLVPTLGENMAGGGGWRLAPSSQHLLMALNAD